MLDYRDLVKNIYEWTQADGRVFTERLQNALEKYCECVSDGVKYEGYGDTNDLLSLNPVYHPDKKFKRDLKKLCEYIQRTYSDYNNGTIAKCIENKWWRKYKDKWRYERVNANGITTYYRMRSKVEGGKIYKTFKRKDLFHTPYEKRELIKSYRYSMIGMPCLYLGCSIYVCWEEMRRANINNLMIAAFRLKDGEKLNLLDLRIQRDLGQATSSDLKEYLMALPLIIACSFKTQSDEGIYKPEYVFPQLVMHMIVKDSASKRTIDGVIYDTTQQEEDFKNYIGHDLRVIENIAIPVYEVADKGYCSRLSEMFSLTQPTTSEYEANKESMFGIASDRQEENTLFYILEERLRKMDFASINE